MKRSSLAGRDGVAALWAIVVLAGVTALLGMTVKQLLLGRRQLDRHEEQMQVAWLARSGVEAACGKLLADPTAYKGETIELIPASSVEVKVEQDPKAKGFFVVTSTARFPTDGRGVVGMRTLVRRIQRVVDKDRVRLELQPGEPPLQKE